jgi:hypothetical protein
MGDRANVYVHDGIHPGVYLYTHWEGTNLPEVVKVSLAKRWRWNDGQYLARIIFADMIIGSERSETGFGISAQVGDGADKVIKVDTKNQEVSLNGKLIPFEEYIKLPVARWDDNDDDY